MAFMQAVLPVWVFAEMVIIQILLSRLVFKQSLLKTVIVSFCVGLCVLVFQEYLYFYSAGSSLALIDAAGYGLLHLMTYAALAYCYMHFINLGETARRIRLIRELHESPGGLSLEQVLKRYNAGVILENRLGRLLNNRQIVLKDGRYYLQGRFMIFAARSVLALKEFLLGRGSEFDLPKDQDRS